MRPMMAVEEKRPHTRHKMVFCACAGNDAMTQTTIVGCAFVP